MFFFSLLLELCCIPGFRVLNLNSIQPANPHVVKHFSVVLSTSCRKFIEFLDSFKYDVDKLNVKTGSKESGNGFGL